MPIIKIVTQKQALSLWLGRFFIAVVVFLNLQAATYFLFRPGDFSPSFELSGIAGNAMIQGIGLLFVMWNIPYIVAMIHPLKYRVSLIEAICMQTIGVVGESTLWCLLPIGHAVLKSSVSRFILFDAADLLLLLIGWALTRKKPQHSPSKQKNAPSDP
ncbi:MAG: hypothetical protein AB9897_00240 [Anaerolineaceae bacterium]